MGGLNTGEDFRTWHTESKDLNQGTEKPKRKPRKKKTKAEIAKEKKLEEDIEYNRKVKAEIKAEKEPQELTYVNIADIMAFIEEGKYGRMLFVTDTTPTSQEFTRLTNVQIINAGKYEKILVRPNAAEIHYNTGSNKIRFICQNKLRMVPTTVNQYEAVIYHQGLTFRL